MGSDADATARARAISRTLWIEGAANLAILAAKAVVGVTTGSTAVISDAIHSLADVLNNAVALVAARLAAAPPDPDHPYGHRRFESLAVFLLATLLSVLAVEIAIRAFSAEREVVQNEFGLALMFGVLFANVALSTWEGARARRLDSDLLRADARHTFSDVLVTLAVIAGWQLGARGYVWIDTALTFLVSILILTLAVDLFRRAVPVLVDQAVIDPEDLRVAIDAVPGVRSVRSVRSRAGDGAPRIDVVVTVDRRLSIEESHAIADAIEGELSRLFASEDVTVHVEPHDGAAPSQPTGRS